MSEKILSLRPNRSSLVKHLDAYIGRAHPRQEQVGLVVVRIKRGGEFGALFGYRLNETLLERFAERLDALCRKEDRIMRIGDHQFAIVLPHIINEGHAILAANKVLRTMLQPFEVENHDISVGIEMGIALFPDHAGKGETLLQHAELALADASRSGVPYLVYTDATPSQMADAWELEQELDTALDNGELEIYYQPKINLRGGLLAGAEALLRWRSPKRGVVPPNAFIPIATRTGQIKPLTWAAINMALENSAAWPTRFGPLSVAVNLAPSLLDDDALLSQVTDAVGMWGTKPNRLILEITESAVMGNPDISFETIRELKRHGVAVSIDDFGTGYSSLSNFKQIPASELKIDKGFVVNMLASKSDMNLVRAIIGLAQAFELQVAAEGAESLAILRTLAALHCTFAQGYYLSPPLPSAAFAQFVNEYAPLAL